MATALCRTRGNGPNSGREPALFRAWAWGPVFHNPFNISFK